MDLEHGVENRARRARRSAPLCGSLFLIAALMGACDADDPGDTAPVRPDGWGAESHDKAADANYAVVFAQDEVKRLDIVISASDWERMQLDMTDRIGEFGAGGSGLPPTPPQEAIDACNGLTAGAACTVAIDGMTIDGTCVDIPLGLVCTPPGGPPGSPGGAPGGAPGGVDLVEGDPIWVESTVLFEDKTWRHVGVRFKGNSTLSYTWQSGSLKLPLKLDFDQFEQEYPAVEDQRFYGFKKLALANNQFDPSYLREKIAGDLFREAGVPSPQRAFYRVFIDTGDGPTYFGLYTVAEVPGKPMFLSQFGDKGGNLYKPEGDPAAWIDGLAVGEESFAKKTNELAADWSDVSGAIDALHASRTDAAGWRRGLEQVFDVDGFLLWLATNTVVQDWDTYGNMAHNYYLYGDPTDGGRLRWIPWDHNMSFGLPTGQKPPLGLDMADVTSDWPLIRFLLDDPTYADLYWSHVAMFTDSVFDQASMEARLTAAHDLIAPYVVGAEGEQPGRTSSTADSFGSSLADLVDHVAARHAAVTQASAQRQ